MSPAENAMNSRTKSIFSGAFTLSLALHGVAYASLTNREAHVPAVLEVSTVSFEVKTPPPIAPEIAPTAPEPVPTPNSTPALEKVPSPKAPTPTPAQTSAPEVTPPAPVAAPLDLSGVTLTNDNGGFAMPIGDGSALHGPIGLGSQRSALASPNANTSAPAPTGPKIVAARDLSEHPRPPSLENLLRANYPAEARERGLRGTASVRARIDADGVIRSARVSNESNPGFGVACRRTVLGSHWSPPRAQNGDAVATEIVYTCHFEVD